MQMIIIKMLIGISIILIAIIALYLIGRITFPVMDPEWQQFGRPRRIIIVLAGVVAVLMIAMLCVMAVAVGDLVMQQIQ